MGDSQRACGRMQCHRDSDTTPPVRVAGHRSDAANAARCTTPVATAARARCPATPATGHRQPPPATTPPAARRLPRQPLAEVIDAMAAALGHEPRDHPQLPAHRIRSPALPVLAPPLGPPPPPIT